MKVEGGGSASPSPMVSIPGAFKNTDPGYTANIYNNFKSVRAFPLFARHKVIIMKKKKKRSRGAKRCKGVRVLTNEMVMLVHRPRPRGVQMLD